MIKKAYTLAKRDPMYRGLAGRIAEIYFLATPHHGADSAKTWKNMDMVAYDRAYVAGLKRNSGAIQVINDEFWHVSAGLNLWSFYEMQHMRRFIPMIVDPEAAVLRSGVDRQVPMDADHRSICKFASPHDGNYVLLRNSLVFTVSRIKSRFPR